MFVIKLGGAALKSTLDDPALFSALASCPEDLIIVHGGGPEINQLAEKLSLKAEFWNGQRITSPEILEVVELVLCGKINPALVRGFLKAGRKAAGVNGSSAGLFSCALENEKLGLVGKVTHVYDAILSALLKAKITPIVAPVGWFENGEPANVNADLAAAAIAKAMRATRLLFLTDKDGVLDSSGEVIREMSAAKLRELSASDTITGGMRVKARAMLEVIDAVPQCRVEVMNGLEPAQLTAALSSMQSGGTLLKV